MYSPIQPIINKTIKQSLHYEEILPSEALSSYVYKYMIAKSPIQNNVPINSQCVPDGTMGITFDLLNSVVNIEGVMHKVEKSFKIIKGLDIITISFKPGKFNSFFDIPAINFSGDQISADQVGLKELQSLLNMLIEMDSTTNRIELIEAHLYQKLEGGNKYKDMRIFNAIQKIYLVKGNLSIEKELSSNISSRQLRRIFYEVIGLSPKTFARIVRFQTILNVLNTTVDNDIDKYYLRLGYYDQSHFLKDWKIFAGDLSYN